MNRDNIVNILNNFKSQTLVAATKYVDVDEMYKLLELGINNFGENRVESFIKKHFIMRNEDIRWHFIGHLQRNKAKLIINDIDFLHSLDSIELVKIIDKLRDKPLNCFIEVKLANSKTKNGINKLELSSFIEECKKYKNINIIGLMTMTDKYMSDIEKTNCFKELKELGDMYNLKEFSMGMSDDYLLAINEGSTFVRLGRVLFE